MPCRLHRECGIAKVRELGRRKRKFARARERRRIKYRFDAKSRSLRVFYLSFVESMLLTRFLHNRVLRNTFSVTRIYCIIKHLRHRCFESDFKMISQFCFFFFIRFNPFCIFWQRQSIDHFSRRYEVNAFFLPLSIFLKNVLGANGVTK